MQHDSLDLLEYLSKTIVTDSGKEYPLKVTSDDSHIMVIGGAAAPTFNLPSTANSGVDGKTFYFHMAGPGAGLNFTFHAANVATDLINGSASDYVKNPGAWGCLSATGFSSSQWIITPGC